MQVSQLNKLWVTVNKQVAPGGCRTLASGFSGGNDHCVSIKQQFQKKRNKSFVRWFQFHEEESCHWKNWDLLSWANKRLMDWWSLQSLLNVKTSISLDLLQCHLQVSITPLIHKLWFKNDAMHTWLAWKTKFLWCWPEATFSLSLCSASSSSCSASCHVFFSTSRQIVA